MFTDTFNHRLILVVTKTVTSLVRTRVLNRLTDLYRTLCLGTMDTYMATTPINFELKKE